MSWAEDNIAHLIGMASLSRKRLEESDVDHEEGHRQYRVWQADVRRLIDTIRDFPEAVDRAFPVGCTNIDAFGNDLTWIADRSPSAEDADEDGFVEVPDLNMHEPNPDYDIGYKRWEGVKFGQPWRRSR